MKVDYEWWILSSQTGKESHTEAHTGCYSTDEQAEDVVKPYITHGFFAKVRNLSTGRIWVVT